MFVYWVCGFKQEVLQTFLDLTRFCLIRCIFFIRYSSPTELLLTAAAAVASLNSLLLLQSFIISVIQSFPSTWQNICLEVEAHVEKKKIDKWFQWARRLLAALPFHVWCHFACQRTQKVFSVCLLCP